MQNTTALQLGAALLIIIGLAMAWLALRAAQQARAQGYDQGFAAASKAHLTRLNLLQRELDDLQKLSANFKSERWTQADAITINTQQLSGTDQQTLQMAAEQLDLLSRTFRGLGATIKATQASQSAQQLLNMAERLRTSPSSTIRSAIVYGPQACGKTRNAQAIADALALKNISDNWVHGTPIPRFDTLALTSDEPPFSIPASTQVLTFTEAMQLVESKHKEAA